MSFMPCWNDSSRSEARPQPLLLQSRLLHPLGLLRGLRLAELAHLLHRGRELGVLPLEGGDRRLLEPPLEERHLGEERDNGLEVAPVLNPPEQDERQQEHAQDEQHDERDPGPERHGAMVPAWGRLE
jgi:hypothetical protein